MPAPITSNRPTFRPAINEPNSEGMGSSSGTPSLPKIALASATASPVTSASPLT